MFSKLSLFAAQKILEDVPFEKCFYTNSGRIIHNLHELEEVLPSLSASEFTHHVNKEKNDFSLWVRDVLGDEQLSKEMRSKDQETMALDVKKRIRSLEKHIDTEKVREHRLETDIYSYREDILKWSLIFLCALLTIVGILLAMNLAR